MRTYLTVFFAAAMLASTAFAADADPFREERFKAKTGRDTQAEETRRQASAQPSNARMEECARPKCCHPAAAPKVAAAAATDFFFNAWSLAKWGRNIRRDRPQIQLALATPAVASPDAGCGHPNCCD